MDNNTLRKLMLVAAAVAASSIHAARRAAAASEDGSQTRPASDGEARTGVSPPATELKSVNSIDTEKAEQGDQP